MAERKETEATDGISDWIDRKMPTREGLAQNRYMKPFAHRFLRSELWRFTRRSVPRGVALGIFAGFIIPVGQILLAAFLALPVRANMPIAALTTFITNPFTFPVWIVAANKVGGFVLSVEALTGEPVGGELDSGRMKWFEWLVAEAGVTAIGFFMMAVIFSAVGYLVASFVWSFIVARKRRRRSRKYARGKAQ